MAVLIEQSVNGYVTDGGDIVFTSNVTSGNLLVVAMSAYVSSAEPAAGWVALKAGSTSTIGTVTLDTSSASVEYGHRTAVWHVYVTGTGSCTLTFTTGNSEAPHPVSTFELSGMVPASPLEDSDIQTGTTTPVATESVASAGAAFFIGALICYQETACAPVSPWTEQYEIATGPARAVVLYQIADVATTDAAEITGPTGTFAWSASAAVFSATQLHEGARFWGPKERSRLLRGYRSPAGAKG